MLVQLAEEAAEGTNMSSAAKKALQEEMSQTDFELRRAVAYLAVLEPMERTGEHAGEHTSEASQPILRPTDWICRPRRERNVPFLHSRLISPPPPRHAPAVVDPSRQSAKMSRAVAGTATLAPQSQRPSDGPGTSGSALTPGSTTASTSSSKTPGDASQGADVLDLASVVPSALEDALAQGRTVRLPTGVQMSWV